MRPRIHDLFGEIPVTWAEVAAWVRAVPGLDPNSKRGRYYITAWNVPEKIRRAKLAGTFDEIVSGGNPPSPFWWSRLKWHHGDGLSAEA